MIDDRMICKTWDDAADELERAFTALALAQNAFEVVCMIDPGAPPEAYARSLEVGKSRDEAFQTLLIAYRKEKRAHAAFRKAFPNE